MRPQEYLKLSPEQYLAQERLAEFKSEYCNGELFAMSGASREHNQISTNIVASLAVQLQDRPCSVYSSDMKVRIAEANKSTYPDIVTACEPQRFEDEHTDVLLNPSVIIEILSDSTEAYDRGLKFFHYQRLDSLREYLLVSQKSCHVEKYERQAVNLWAYSEYHALDDTMVINTIHCKLPLADIYRKVILKESLL
jgi:Uma2 family endonuclease